MNDKGERKMIKLHEGPQLVLHDDVLASVSEHPEIDLAAAKQPG